MHSRRKDPARRRADRKQAPAGPLQALPCQTFPRLPRFGAASAQNEEVRRAAQGTLAVSQVIDDEGDGKKGQKAESLR